MTTNTILNTVVLLGVGSCVGFVITYTLMLRSRNKAREQMTIAFLDQIQKLAPAYAGSAAAVKLAECLVRACASGRVSLEAIAQEIQQAIDFEYAQLRAPFVNRAAAALPAIYQAIACIEVMDTTGDRERLLAADALDALNNCRALLTTGAPAALQPTED